MSIILSIFEWLFDWGDNTDRRTQRLEWFCALCNAGQRMTCLDSYTFCVSWTKAFYRCSSLSDTGHAATASLRSRYPVRDWATLCWLFSPSSICRPVGSLSYQRWRRSSRLQVWVNKQNTSQIRDFCHMYSVYCKWSVHATGKCIQESVYKIYIHDSDWEKFVWNLCSLSRYINNISSWNVRCNCFLSISFRSLSNVDTGRFYS